jgi:GNAT superfamily N-acetyltransferase
MSADLQQVYLSAIDEERFGIRTARAPHVTFDTLPWVMNFCRTNNVVLVIARCLCSELRTAQAMEREGFVLMDTLVYCVRDLTKGITRPEENEISIRRYRPGDEEAVKIVAAEAYRGYLGHYHADERLDRAKCDETYVSWALRSCASRDVADEVLIAEIEGSIVGYFTLRLNNLEEGEAVVGGVRHSARGKGIYRSFIIRGMEWCLSKGATRMLVSTQITNVAVQKVWARLGFEPSHAFYTFHKWFDKT